MEFTQWLEQSWVYLAAFAAAIVTVRSLFKNIKEIKDKLEAPQKAQMERLEKLEAHINGEDVSMLPCGPKWSHIEQTEEKFNQEFLYLNEGMTSLLRDRINSYFDRCNDKGYLSKTELEIVTDLYKAYHKMGGNGLISREMEIINKFPVFDNEEDYQNWLKNKKASN